MMVPQTTAAALVSENKALGWPASIDSIPTCEDQEDHVAMSTTAARRAAAVVENARNVIAIEMLGASRALLFRRAEDPATAFGSGTAMAMSRIDGILDELGDSAIPSHQIAALSEWILQEGHHGVVQGLLPAGRTS